MDDAATVGVREVRQNLSRYLERVKAGEELVITERGREVARLIPSGIHADSRTRLARLLGVTAPAGRPLEHLPHLPAPGGPPTSDVLDELRGERV